MDSAKLIIECLRHAVLGEEIDRKNIESLNEAELKITQLSISKGLVQ